MEEFDNQQFSVRMNQALNYILSIYGIDKHLIQRYANKRTSWNICLQCDNLSCSFMISCKKYRKSDTDQLFKYEQENSFLQHGQKDSNDNIISFCSK